ncbi:hypothetical protein AXF24_13175 [Streptococcus pneumoniae]|uniref:hypothetical protein n=1 Tax=Streptococcus pneumoniae TaxID=1313 RepID=UPI00077262F8|nr:hypothetical protein AWW74_13185 [Streptococcus pneumoniae]KXB96193.1 hypothetical protein AXF24_13175 [Streptococcus pneumoniae]
MGPDFPSHCVMLFDTEREAVLYAVKCIVDNDENAKYVEEEALWTMGEDHWDSADDFLDAWQHGLDISEFFHFKPVEDVVVQEAI